MAGAEATFGVAEGHRQSLKTGGRGVCGQRRGIASQLHGHSGELSGNGGCPGSVPAPPIPAGCVRNSKAPGHGAHSLPLVSFHQRRAD